MSVCACVHTWVFLHGCALLRWPFPRYTTVPPTHTHTHTQPHGEQMASLFTKTEAAYCTLTSDTCLSCVKTQAEGSATSTADCHTAACTYTTLVKINTAWEMIICNTFLSCMTFNGIVKRKINILWWFTLVIVPVLVTKAESVQLRYKINGKTCLRQHFCKII